MSKAVEFDMRGLHENHGFILNGRAVSFGGDAPQTTLLDFIRAQGLTGAKEGCAEGECGACAVLFVCPAESGATYRAVNSCLVPLPAVADREVFTVEGLASGGQVQGAQRAMAEFGGSQCGYCTPGFAIGMVAEHYRPKTGACDTHSLGGNLCRCTGFMRIFESVAAAVDAESAGPATRLTTEQMHHAR